MTRRGKAIARTAIALSLAVVVGAVLASKDRIAEEWWLHKLRNGNAGEREKAADSLAAIGSLRAVPHLTQILSQETLGESRWGPLQSQLRVGPPVLSIDQLHYAAGALVRIGSPAIQALLDAYKRIDQDVYHPFQIQYALENIRPARVEHFQEALRDKDERVRAFAAICLSHADGEVPQAVAALVESLNDEACMVRESAAQTIAILGSAALGAVPALIEVLRRDDCIDAQIHASNALVEIGAEESRIMDLAWVLMNPEEDALVRRNVAKTLGRIGAPAVSVLLGALRSNRDSIRSAAIRGLIELRPRAAAVAALQSAMEEGDRQVRGDAAKALRELREESTDAGEAR
jgi:HEAT repeat protein